MVRAVLLALLVAVALPVGVAGGLTDGTSGAPAGSLQDEAILTLDGSERTDLVPAVTDVSTALTIQHASGRDTLDRYTLAERVRTAESTAARRTILQRARSDADGEISRLRIEEQSLRTAYANQEIDTAAFLRGLVLLHVRATGIRSDLDTIQRHANDIPEFSLNEQVQRLDTTMYGLDGPVRQLALAALLGDTAPTRLYVATTEDGFVLSTVVDGRFVREAQRADNREPDSVEVLSINEADERAGQLYPVSYNISAGLSTGINYLSGGVHRIEINLQEGRITSYLDGSTRNVFFEVQERRLDLLADRPSVVAEANGTWLAVNRSYPGGPLHIAVADNETRQPRETTVFVDETRIETDADGTAWTLAPSTSVEVTAVTPDGNVTAFVRPFTPTSVNN